MDTTTDLPEFVQMSEVAYKTYLSDWLLWIGTGRKFLPQSGGLADQYEAQMQVILELDAHYSKILIELQNQKKEDSDATKV